MLRTTASQSVSLKRERDDSVSVDLGTARRYLRELAAACVEGATNPNPQVTLLALGLVAKAGGELIA
jgi:hypothetical protein